MNVYVRHFLPSDLAVRLPQGCAHRAGRPFRTEGTRHAVHADRAHVQQADDHAGMATRWAEEEYVHGMVRLLLGFLVQLLANALGLLVATWVLDDVSISGAAFLVAVLLFTVVYALAQPFLTQMALSKAPALRGGVALIATLIGLVVTAAVSDGLSVTGGAWTWIEATIIVWLVSLLGVLVLPLVLIRKQVSAS